MRNITFIALIVGLSLGCGIRQDELRCEEAVAHLDHCCPNFPHDSISCQYMDGLCENPYYPDISVEQSECIIAKSCDAIRAAGLCQVSSAPGPDAGTALVVECR